MGEVDCRGRRKETKRCGIVIMFKFDMIKICTNPTHDSLYHQKNIENY